MTITDEAPAKVRQLSNQFEQIGELTDWVTEHRDEIDALAGPARIDVGLAGVKLAIQCRDAEEFAEGVRFVMAGAPIGSIEKEADHEYPRVRRILPSGASIEAWTIRERVCNRILVGTETVTVPDPDAPLVTIEQEKWEWECSPILAGGAA